MSVRAMVALFDQTLLEAIVRGLNRNFEPSILPLAIIQGSSDAFIGDKTNDEWCFKVGLCLSGRATLRYLLIIPVSSTA